MLAHDVLRALTNREHGEEWLDFVAARPAAAHTNMRSELAPVAARIQIGLNTLRPLVLAPEEADGRRIALGMARVTQAAILVEAAEWRLAQKQDRSALIAAELVTQSALVAEKIGGMDLESLAFGNAAAQDAALRAA